MEKIDTNTPAPSSKSWRRFARAYGRILSLRTAPAADLAIPSNYVWLFPAIGLILWLIADRWWAGEGAEFYSYGVLSWSWFCVVLLGVTWLCGRFAQPRLPYERVLAPLLVLVPVFIALQIARLQWLDERWDSLATLGIAVYALLSISRVLTSLTLRLQPRAVCACMLALFGAVWFAEAADVSGGFWYQAPEDSVSDTTGDPEQTRQSEALLFTQSERIDAAVRALQRPAELPAAAFFLGFAGVGEQHVFATEIELAQQVIADKFDTGHRSIRLVNDERDVELLPLASPTALRYALKRMASRMNLEQDVLFLSLSSHGSEDGKLSVSNGLLALNDLSAIDVAAALRESGIRWKIVIVSACYAGNFIPLLRDENTIVIAAAAADRTSFGCADDRDLTYFGEAFYRDALPDAATLRAAFQRATAEIAKREKAEDKVASMPQAHFGRDIEAHLREVFGHR